LIFERLCGKEEREKGRKENESIKEEENLWRNFMLILKNRDDF
jgi:hypothetical protein